MVSGVVHRKWSRRFSRTRPSSAVPIGRRFATEPGSAHPFGVTACRDGVNFSLFSEGATEVVLLLFDASAPLEPMQTIRLDPFANKTFHFWHVFVRGCRPGMLYAFRIDGPDDPQNGERFNANKVLMSPYARGVSKDALEASGRDRPARQPGHFDARRRRRSVRLRLGRRSAAQPADSRVDHLRAPRRRLHAFADVAGDAIRARSPASSRRFRICNRSA